MTIQVPVALIVYNRVDTTARVLERIAAARPRKLFVLADGPNPDKPGDAEKCRAVRALFEHLPWECELFVERAQANIGPGRRINSGLDCVFARCDEAIILEDDCLPEPTFFPFCEELLERYRHDERVFMITGDNFQFGRRRGPHSYYFSISIGTWGFATWRRAWKHFDCQMPTWPAVRESTLLRDVWNHEAAATHWRNIFDATFEDRERLKFDYPWALTMWQSGGLQISPNTNLVSYIGCLPDAPHTTDLNAIYCNLPTEPMPFPLSHPAEIAPDRDADIYEFERITAPQPVR